MAEKEGFVCIFAKGKNYGSARSSPRWQQFTELLHLSFQIPLLFPLIIKHPPQCGGCFIMAEKEGFEPSKPFWGLHDFQSCALGQLRDFSKSFLVSFDILQ